MHRRPIVIGNWKMHTTAAEAVTLARRIAQAAERLDDLDIVICPPVIWLPTLVETLHHRPQSLSFGVQNIYPALSGSVTGEIGLEMIKGLAEYVIIGHSERRALFYESDEIVHEKVRAVLDQGLKPIVCVGELTPRMLKIRGRGRPTKLEHQSDLIRLLRIALQGLHGHQLERLIICYEPLWAIGTGENVPGAHAAAILHQLRRFVQDQFGGLIADRIRTIYGGSVTQETIDEYVLQAEIDGVLVGGASLSLTTFLPIIEAVAERAVQRRLS